MGGSAKHVLRNTELAYLPYYWAIQDTYSFLSLNKLHLASRSNFRHFLLFTKALVKMTVITQKMPKSEVYKIVTCKKSCWEKLHN